MSGFGYENSTSVFKILQIFHLTGWEDVHEGQHGASGQEEGAGVSVPG